MKEKSYLLFKSLIIFLLKKTVNKVQHYAIIFQEKAEMLKKHFFSEKLQADLDDMKEVIYFLEIKLFLQISVKNI
jgi:hypothetical protein